MKTKSFLPLTAALAMVAPALRAQTEWSTRVATDGTVRAIAVLTDRVVIGGDFTTFSQGSMGGSVWTPYTRHNIARVSWDGDFDPNFDPDANGPVYAIAGQKDGRVVIGGAFTALGATTRYYVARLNVDGTVDTSFNSSLFGAVNALAVQLDGKILIGGVSGITRVNADGTADSSFNPPATGAVYGLAMQPDGKILVSGSSFIRRLNANGGVDSSFTATVNGAIYAIALQHDGKILVGGRFSNLNGVARYGLDRLNTNGSLDSTFYAYQGQYFNADSAVWTILVQVDGAILVGGNLGWVPRFSGSGAIDTTAELRVPGNVWALALQQGPLGSTFPGRTMIILGGTFSSVGNFYHDYAVSNFFRVSNLVDGAPSRFLVYVTTGRIEWVWDGQNPDLAWVQFEFTPDINPTGASIWSPIANGTFYSEASPPARGWAATVSPMHVRGSFRAVGYYPSGGYNSSGSMFIDVATGFDNAYDTTAAVTSNASGPVLVGASVTFTATVSSPATSDVPTGTVAFLDGSTAIAGCGAQTLSNGQATCSASFASVGLHNITAQYGGAVEFHSSTSGAYGITVVQGTTTTALTSSPNFSMSGSAVNLTATVTSTMGVPTGTVAFFDGLTSLGSANLNASGVAVLTTSALVTTGRHSITAQYGGTAGYLGSTSAVLTQNVRVPQPPLDLGFNPGTDFPVTALAVQQDGKILVGGLFTNLGPRTRNYIGRLRSDVYGSLDYEFDPGANAPVFALAVQPDDKILVGGRFTSLAGQPRNYIGRLNSDGSLDTSFDPGADQEIVAFAEQPDGKIVVGGAFTTLGGQPRALIGRLNADGSLDTTFNAAAPPAGAGCEVYALAVQPDGKILMGRSCNSDIASSGLMRLTSSGATDWFVNNLPVHTLALQPDGKILVGGSFGAKRLNSNGTVDSSFQATFPSAVYALALHANGKVVVGGNFENLYRLNPDGTIDFASNVAIKFSGGGKTYALAIQPDGHVVVGGNFNEIASSTSQYPNIGRLGNDQARYLQFTFDVNTGQLAWTWGGCNPQLMWATFQFSTDGSNWSTVASATPVSGVWTGTVSQPHVKGTFRALGYYEPAPGSGSVASSGLTVDYAYNTTTAVLVTPASPQLGQAATITATVTPVAPGTGTPTGFVVFSDGGTTIAGCDSQPVSNGQAACNTSFSTVGLHTITAQYGGDAGFHGSTSSGYQLTVVAPPVVTTTSIGAPSVVYGTNGSVTVTVVAGSGAAAPTGSVSLIVDSGVPASQSLTAGPGTSSTATFTVNKPSAGLHLLSATYTPSGNFTASGPSSGSLTVNPATLTATVTGSQTYGGTNKTFSAVYTGYVVGDTAATVPVSGTLACGASATAASPVGSNYTVSNCSGVSTSNTNYAIGYTYGSFTVNPATLTAIVGGSQTYGGTNRTFSAEINGYVGDDTEATDPVTGTPSCVVNATDTSPVGSVYRITSCSGLSPSSSNYTLGYMYVAFLVYPATLTATVTGSQTYGGSNRTFSAVYSGYVGSDNAATVPVSGPLVCGGNAFTNSPVGGSYKVLDCIGLSTSNTNYVIGYAYGSFIVNAATLTATVTGSQTYGGSNRTFSAVYSGYVNSDTAATVPVSGTLACSASAAASSPAGSNYTVSSCSGVSTSNTNYAIGYAYGSFTVAPAPLTITPDGSKTKTYGQTFTGFTGTVSGLKSPDVVTVTYASPGAAGGAVPGSYDISVAGYAFAPGSASNYSITSNSATHGLTVLPAMPGMPGLQSSTSTYGATATLSVTVSAAGGGATPTGSVMFQFVRNGTTYNVCSDGSLQPQPAATPCSVVLNAAGTASLTTTSLPVGADSITATYSGDTNYSGGQTSLSVTVGLANSQTTLSITPNSPTPTYGDTLILAAVVTDNSPGSTGTPTGTVQFAFSKDGTNWTNIGSPATLAAGQAQVQTAALPAGTPKVRASYSGDANFTASTIAANQSVNPKQLTVSGIMASDKTYDGTRAATLNTSGALLVGVLAADSVTLAAFGAVGAFVDPNVGSNKTVQVSGVNVSGAAVNNYTLVQPTAAASIIARGLSITANNDNKTYGQTRTYGAGSSAFTSSGLQNGETIGSVTITASGGTAANSPVQVYNLTPSSPTGGTFLATNYSIAYHNGTLTVGAAPLDITANNDNKTYGQTKTYGPASTAFTSSGLQNGETIGSVTITASGGTAVNSLVGPYDLTPGAATGGTFLATNYRIAYHNGTLTVKAAALDITANNDSKTYGQTKSYGPVSTAFTSIGLQNSETIGSVTLSSTGATAAAAVGSYLIVPSAAAGGSFVATNYSITYHNGTLRVDPSPLDITANNDSKTYGQTKSYGSGSTAFTTSGLQNAESIGSVTLSSAGATAAAAVGSYPIVPSAATGGSFTAGNYLITYHNGTLTVNAAGLTVTADNQSRSYGTENPALTFTANVGGATVFTTPPVCSTAATASSPVGSYTITCSGGTAPNFTITGYTPGKLTVTPAAATTLIATLAPGSTTPITVQQYSDRVTLRASLSPWILSGRKPATTVTFWMGTQTLVGGANLGSCTLDSGACAITVPLLDAVSAGMPAQPPTANFAPGPHTVYAVFGGALDSSNFSFSAAVSTPLTITAEGAAATYTGPAYASTSSPTSTTSVVALAATIQDASALSPADSRYDANSGDIRNATVTFVNRDTGATIASNVPVGLVNPSDPKTGTATYNWPVTIPNCATPPCTKSFTIGFIVSGYYTRGATADNAVVEVGQPGSGDSVTGSGSLVLQSPAGLTAPDSGGRSDFAFDVKYNKNGANPQGSVSITVRGNGHTYQIEGTSMTSLEVEAADSPATATFNGSASIQDITNSKRPVAVDSDASVQVEMTDTGKPQTDTIGITVWNKRGGLWFSSSWNGSRTVQQKLGSGSLKVH